MNQSRTPCHIQCIPPLFTRFGTKFTSEVDLTNKRLGIGVVNGFIGRSIMIEENFTKYSTKLTTTNRNRYTKILQNWQKYIFILRKLQLTSQ